PDAPCHVEGSGVSGIDNCALGSVCFEVDPKTNDGVCRALCVSPSEPCGGDQSCVAYVPGILELCVQGCDPLAPDCAAGTCAPAADGFTCVPGGAQALGDPCTQPSDCAGGSLCVSGDLLPACDAVGCCAAACNVEAPDVCDALLSCEAWDSNASPPWDHVGVCIEL
ncbi:MAG: hypothetical protein IAG13_22950, partial [Deltaproteobacteria bacterium]|nr:hypothetical protein [Nannocystaceae bacterium]